MEYRDGIPHVRVNLGSDNITITGNVNIADHITVDNTLTNPIPVFLTQTATVFVNNFTSTVFASNFTSTVRISSMPAITGTVTVSNFTSTVRVSLMPGITGTVAISSLPAVTGTVTVSNFTSTVYQGTDPWSISGNVTVTNFTSTVYVSNFTSTVHVDNFPTAITVTNFTSTVNINTMPSVTITNTSFAITNFPTTSTVYQGTTPWVVTGTVNIGTLPEVEIKNDSGNPIPISATTASNSALNPLYIAGNVSTIGGSAQGKLWTMQISQGLIAGHTTEQVTGYNPTTSAGDAVWSGATAYPWSSLVTAQTLYLKSSTNNATDRGMSIFIDGLDANYANQTEVITLNASDSRTAVATTKQFLRIHEVRCNGADTNVGDIITTVTSGSGTVVSKMSAGRGSAKAGVYTVPAGYTGYLFKGDASSTAATVVNFMGRYFGKAFMVLHVAIVDNSTYIYDFPFPMPLPEKTDMYTVIEAGSGKTAVNYEILLVAN
jgi:hypothetical protein